MSGYALYKLVFESQDWVHRRVDKIRLSSAGLTRKEVSLDISVPTANVVRSRDRKNSIVVPLAVLQKGPLRAFSVCDGNGRNLPIMNTKQHAGYVSAMLEAALDNCKVKPKFRCTEPQIRDAIASVVTAYKSHERETAKNNLLNLLDFNTRTASSQLHDFARSLIDTLADSYLLLVELDRSASGSRMIIKYSYDEAEFRKSKENTRDYNEVVFKQTLPDPGFAYSQHVEVSVPDELEIDATWISWRYAGEKPVSVHEPARVGQKVSHVSTPGVGRYATAKVIFSVRPTKDGLQRFVAWSTWTVFTLVLTGWIVRLTPPESILGNWDIPSPAVSVLLIAPAFMFSWVARTAENAVVSRTLFPLRALLILLAGMLILLAFTAAVPLNPHVWSIVWILEGLAAGFSSIYWALYCRYRKRQPKKRR